MWLSYWPCCNGCGFLLWIRMRKQIQRKWGKTVRTWKGGRKKVCCCLRNLIVCISRINYLHISVFYDVFSNVSWVLANITSESSHCFWKGNRNSGRRLCIMVCPSFWEDYYMLIYTHCWELMNSVGSHGSLSLPFVMKVMVCHFVSDSHEVMTALIVMLPIIVVVEISLQLHQALWCIYFPPDDQLLTELDGITEKARLQAEALAAKREAALEARRVREMEREAARRALQQVTLFAICFFSINI